MVGVVFRRVCYTQSMKGGKSMISSNISALRKAKNLSQEALAERLGVSRQTVAKWESGESLPDVLHCDQMAEVFEVSLDDLIHADMTKANAPPQGKYIFGTVTVGDKGQVVIPVKARRIFHIQPGDNLVVLGDIQHGLALLRADLFLEVARQMQEANNESRS